MNIQEQKKWLEYWRRSLLDAEKADIKIKNAKDDNIIIIDDFDPKSEEIPEEKKDKNKGILDRLKVTETRVLISPFLFKRSNNGVVFSPFWYMANINTDGKLSVPKENDGNFSKDTIIIPRKYLSPVFNDRDNENFILCDLEKAEEITANNNCQYEKYADYIDYVCRVFNSVIGNEGPDPRDIFRKYEPSGKPIYKESRSDNNHITKSNTGIILFYEGISTKPGKHILNLFNYLCDEYSKSNYPSLLSRMISGEKETESFIKEDEWININEKHLGHMKADRPLSSSQRRSLYTILNQWDKPVHVVNGPPGTGKTTLLQSVVADLIVKSAIESGEPYIIWGTAATNQAVKNILDSFSKVDNIRWLPVDSSFHGGYGTFLPSSAALNDTIKNNYNYIFYNYDNQAEEGTFSEIQKEDYLKKANKTYVENAKVYFKFSDSLELEDIIKKLADELCVYKKFLENVTELTKLLMDFSREFPEYINSESPLRTVIDKESSEWDEILKSASKDINSMKDEVRVFREEHSKIESAIEGTKHKINKFEKKIVRRKYLKEFVACLSSFIKLFSAKKTLAKFSVLKENYEQEIESFSSKKTALQKSLSILIKDFNDINSRISVAQSQITRKEKEYSYVSNIKDCLEKVKIRQDLIEKIPDDITIPQTDRQGFYSVCDTLRTELFALAIRYWEGRWLIETNNKKNRNDFVDKMFYEIYLWKQRAMLTPCFVSTFHSAPKCLSYCDSTPQQKQYLIDFVDCLIIDEAGQASPEISIPIFSLAKKAIVVGDIKQIEPVWNILKSVDTANLDKFGITRLESEEFKGRCCSCGSIMKIAQAACTIKDDSIEERGNFLEEHYRCLPEIIQFCSDNAYKSKIKCKRTKDIESFLPPMGFYNVESSDDTKSGNTRFNKAESQAICEWIKDNREDIEKQYNMQIEKCVGIITPFRGQKEKLNETFNEKGLIVTNELIIGTVHALQGAERPIIIFSSVYSEADKVQIKFFDKNINMLNVAVSRAKDSFILFGDERIFCDKTTPSGKLFEIVRKNRLN